MSFPLALLKNAQNLHIAVILNRNDDLLILIRHTSVLQVVACRPEADAGARGDRVHAACKVDRRWHVGPDFNLHCRIVVWRVAQRDQNDVRRRTWRRRWRWRRRRWRRWRRSWRWRWRRRVWTSERPAKDIIQMENQISDSYEHHFRGQSKACYDTSGLTQTCNSDRI